MSRLGDLTASNLSKLDVLPIANYMPPGGIEFRPATYIAIPNQGASAVVVQFKIPKGRNAILNRLANVYVGGGFQEGQALITWQLFLEFYGVGNASNVVAPNFNLIVASLGSISNPAALNGLRAKENTTLALVVSNANPGVVPAGQLIGGLLGGYHYSKTLEPADFGS